MGVLFASTMLASAPAAMAQSVMDGHGGTGYVVTNNSALSATNSNIVGSQTIGSASSQTVYTNFSTVGGAGSGGGGGLGGVFFVDNATSLTLNNVSFTNNTATGGQGGGVKVDSVGPIAFSIAGAKADASALSQFDPTLNVGFNNGSVQINSFTLAQSSSLFGAGSGVGVAVKGQPTVVGATVSTTTLNTDGTETVNLAAPLTLTPGNGVDQVVQTAFGYTFFNGNSSANIMSGMQVVIPNGTVYTVDTVSYDSNGNVSSFTLKDSSGNPATVPLLTSMYVVNAQQYNFTRLATTVNGSTQSNTLVSTGPVAGFAPGMTVSGTGVPTGTKVTAVNVQTDQSTGDVTTTVTLNNAVNLTTATDLTATANPVVSNSGQAVLSLPSASGLSVGETITGVGIPSGTTIVSISGNNVTLSNALAQGAINAIANNSLLVSVNPVIGTATGSSVKLASVVGLTVGAELTGQAGIPANAQITRIDTATNTVYYTPNPALANANTGGSMNNLKPAAGAPATNGDAGQTGTSYSSTFDNGEGAPGTNGQTAGNGVNGPGGKGGNGGSGSNGSSTNKTLITSTVLDSLGLAADFLTTADNAAGLFTLPSVPGDIAHTLVDAAHAVFDITQLVAWQIAEQQGLVALGGGGGQGGNGGAGSTFFGGGAAGNGGQGGQGAESYTLGGLGGTGGNGGLGGFGAGGGDSGAGGLGGSTGHQANGAPGTPGVAGFGGGVGSTAGQFGQGGSGFGGALFVAAGGAVNITGNAVFQNNTALAGSSSNGGSVGQAAGQDLFMMTGSTVSLTPGAGNTITFYDSIADDSAASLGTSSIAAGSGAGLHIFGPGTVQLFGTNTYSGTTEISGGTLEAQDGTGINALSHILFDGTGSIGSGLSSANAGVLLSGGTFTRSTGSLPNNVSWTGSGGFAATSAGLTVSLGATNGGSQQTLVWNQGGFVPGGSTLVFGSDAADATGVVTLANAINLNNQVGKIAVVHNAGNTGSYDAVLAGKVYGGTLVVNDTGYTGTLLMPAQNSLTGVTLNGGTLSTILNGQSGRLMDANAGGFVTINGGNLVLGGPEKLTTVSIALGGGLTALGAVTAGDITNAGVAGFASTLQASSITNSGIMMLGGQTTVANAIANQAGGTLYQNGATSASSVTNAGTWNLAADLTASGSVQNSGVLNVIGAVSGTPSVETAATRTLTTTAFSGSGTVNLGGLSGAVANTLVINQSGGSTYSGAFTGAGGLTKTGAGAVVLTGANTFTGPLAINGGTLDTTGGGTFADSVNVTVGQAGTYIVGADDTINSLTNSGTTTVNAALTLASLTNTATGTATVNGTLTASGNVSNANSLTFAAGSTEAIGGNLSNTGVLTSAGALSVTNLVTNDIGATATLGAAGSSHFGALTNNGALTASSPLTVDTLVTNSTTGTMALNAGSTSQFGSLTNSGVLTAAAPLTVTGLATNTVTGTMTLNAGAASLFGSLANSGALTASAPLTVLGLVNNAATGVITLNAGATPQFGSLTNSGVITSQDLVTVTGPYEQDAGSLTVRGGLSTGSLSGSGGAINLNNNSAFAVNQTTNGTFAGTINGNGNVSVAGGATLTLTGVNTYTGATTINPNTTLALMTGGSIATSQSVADNGIFDISQTTTGASIMTLSGNGTAQLGAKTLTITNGSTTFDGTVVDGGIGGGTAGNLTVSGGTETLTGANTYTGATRISSGATLALKTGGSIAASSGVADNGTFDISQTTTGASIATLSGSGQAFLGAKTLMIANGSTTFAGVIADGGIGGGSAGNLTVWGGTQTLTGVNTYTGATGINSGATLALMAGGSIAPSSGVVDLGVFDISQTTTGASIMTLSGNGSTSLGSKTLTITNGSTTFAGVIADGGLGGGAAGNLTVAAGTQTLTGVNTYTGATGIGSGATLVLQGAGAIAPSSGVADNGTFDISQTTTGASIATLSGNGAALLGSKTLTITNGSTTFGGVISDGGLGGGAPGNLTVAGGAQTLTGVNTYTGATRISSGATLALGNAGSIAKSAGLTNNGVFDISQTTSGASIITLGGAGSVALGGQFLTITNGMAGASGTAPTGVFSGAIGGSGGLAITGGHQELTGTSTYAGGTTVSNAILSIGSGASLGAPTGPLTLNNATLVADNSLSTSRPVTLTGSDTIDTGSYNVGLGGTIAGAGSLYVAGSGTLTLSGTNTGSGGILVGPTATLASTSSAALGSDPISLVSANNTVVNAFTSGVHVLGPLNLVNGPQPQLYIGAGDSLVGIGTVNANVVVQSGGLTAPGDGAGTIVVNGSVTNLAGSTFQVDVDGLASSVGCTNILGCAGAYSSLVVAGSGNAYVAGGVIAPLLRGIAPPANNTFTPSLGASFTVVQAAGGVQGSYASLTQPVGLAAGTRFDALYYPNTIVLVVTPATFQSIPGVAAPLNVNQNQVAGALDALRGPAGLRNNVGATQDLATIYGITPAAMPTAFTSLSGEVATGAKWAGFKMNTEFLSLMSDAGQGERSGLKAKGAADPHWQLWGSVFGVSNSVQGSSETGTSRLNAKTAGVSMGAEYRFTPDFVAGIAGAGGHNTWSIKQSLGSGRSEEYMFGVYADWRRGQGYVSASADVGDHQSRTDRTTLSGENLKAKYSGSVYGGRLEAGYSFLSPSVSVTPYAAVQAQGFKTPTYSEADTAKGDFGLTYKGQTSSDTRTELGARFNLFTSVGASNPLILGLRAAWAHDVFGAPGMNATFNAALQPGALPGAAASFAVKGAMPGHDAGLIALNASMRASSRVSFDVKFDGGEFSNGSQTYGVSGTVRINW